MFVTCFRVDPDQRTNLEDRDGADGDQDDNPDVDLGGQTAAVVGVIVLVVFLRMIQHVVVVPSTVLVLHSNTCTRIIIDRDTSEAGAHSFRSGRARRFTSNEIHVMLFVIA